jgi:hypothetical protein
VALLKSGTVDAFFAGAAEPNPPPPPKVDVVLLPEEPKADGAEDVPPKAEDVIGVPPNTEGAGEPNTELVFGADGVEPKALLPPNAGVVVGADVPNAEGAAGVDDPNTDVDDGGFVVLEVLLPKALPPPKADVVGAGEPNTEVEGWEVAVFPNVEG